MKMTRGIRELVAARFLPGAEKNFVGAFLAMAFQFAIVLAIMTRAAGK